jgi:hypothetical protein
VSPLGPCAKSQGHGSEIGKAKHGETKENEKQESKTITRNKCRVPATHRPTQGDTAGTKNITDPNKINEGQQIKHTSIVQGSTSVNKKQ